MAIVIDENGFKDDIRVIYDDNDRYTIVTALGHGGEKAVLVAVYLRPGLVTPNPQKEYTDLSKAI